MTANEPRLPKDVTILIVEDSPTQALKLTHVLERNGFTVVSAPDGVRALEALGASLPTLVITDINMPKMDGYELCRRIKDDPTLARLPVILLTSLADPKDILKGLECGADNFIVKPYDEEFLLSRIHYVLANLALRQRSDGRPLEIYFAGHTYQLTTDRVHSIDLLLSTYETAVQKNLELSAATEKLERQTEELRGKNTQMEEELAMARELQNAFLPRHYPVFPANASPERSAIQFCHRYSPIAELGGDFFHILALSDTKAGVLICDVMGHGVRAALIAAIVRGLVEELKPVADDPGKFLTTLNEALCGILKQTVTPVFATACYVVADLVLGEFRHATAGHPAPYHLRRSAGVLEALGHDSGKPGPALGIFEEAAYATKRNALAAGDLLMLFTDGLYEIEGNDGALYEKEQFIEAITRRLALPAPQLFDELLAEIQHFAAGEKFDDDMCLVGLEVKRLAGAGKS